MRIYISLLVTMLCCINGQRLCSHTGPCTIFADQRDELIQQHQETSEDNMPQSNRQFLLNQELQDLQRAQQIAQQQTQQLAQKQAQQQAQQEAQQQVQLQAQQQAHLQAQQQAQLQAQQQAQLQDQQQAQLQAQQQAQLQALQQAQRKAQQQAQFAAQQQAQQETQQQLQNYYNYDPPVAKNISLNILNLAQAMSRQFQHQSLHGEQIFSPISIFSVLQLLLTGANGKTYSELNRLLSYRSNMGSPESQEEFGKLIEDLVSDEINKQRLRPDANWKFSPHENDGIDKIKPGKIRLANAVFIQKGVSIRPSYRSVIENIYKSQIENVDFYQKDYVEQYINRWVNEKTYGKIPSIINKNSFDSSTSMIMACAVYFKAFWEKPFINGATMVKDFYPDGTDDPSTKIKANMMANGGYFPYYEDPNYKIKVIGFPYSQGSSTMYIFQPYDSTRERLRQMQTTLTPEMIEYMISQMKQKNSVFIFPRLHITNSFDLRNHLKSLGLDSVFSLDKSDLSLIKEPKPYYSNIDSFQKPIENKLAASAPILYPSNDEQISSRPMNIIYPANINLQPLFGSPSNENPTTNTPTTKKNLDFVFKVNSRIGASESDTDNRTTILSRVYDKEFTRRIRETPNGYLNYLQSIRNSPELIKPDLYVDNILHKIDLVINEEGTEGAAVTSTILKKSGPDVVFRAETPFLILLRHDTTKIPIFYGAIFEPTLN